MTFDFWSGLGIGTTIGVFLSIGVALKVFNLKLKDLFK